MICPGITCTLLMRCVRRRPHPIHSTVHTQNDVPAKTQSYDSYSVTGNFRSRNPPSQRSGAYHHGTAMNIVIITVDLSTKHTIQYSTYNAVQYNTIHTIQYNIIHTIQYYTIQYSTVQER